MCSDGFRKYMFPSTKHIHVQRIIIPNSMYRDVPIHGLVGFGSVWYGVVRYGMMWCVCCDDIMCVGAVWYGSGMMRRKVLDSKPC